MLELFNEYRVSAQHVTSILLAMAVWRWGAGPERWIVSAFIATMVAPMYLVGWLDFGNPAEGPFGGAYIALDLTAAGLFVAIALNANRNYPLWVAGFQVVAVVAHGVRTLIDTVSPVAAAILVIGPSYCQLIVILAGVARHYTRLNRFGPYREWRTSPPGTHWLSL